MKRRAFLASLGAAARAAAGWTERLGIMCQLGAGETGARRVLAAARAAGFTRIQASFSWDRVEHSFVTSLPGWLRAEGLRCDALGAYVNCVAPDAVVMNTRAADFERAIGVAGTLGCGRLVAWTGGYRAALMEADERNFSRAAEDAIVRFVEGHLPRLEGAGVRLALETYITLACPDAIALRRLLGRLPGIVGAVLDPPNLTPITRFPARDEVLRETFAALRGRIGVVHLKDFRLNAEGRGYDLPGPLRGEMNYPLLAELLRSVPEDVPVVAEHVGPGEFADTRQALLRVLK